MKSSKALASRTVILLLLAVIILAIAVYLAYIQFIAGNQNFDYSKCISSLKSRCSTCCLIGISSDGLCIADASNTASCGSKPPIDFTKNIPCQSLGIDLSKCKSLIG